MGQVVHRWSKYRTSLGSRSVLIITVTDETAVIYATRKAAVQRGIDQIRQKRGEKTTDIEGLKIDIDYDRKPKK